MIDEEALNKMVDKVLTHREREKNKPQSTLKNRTIFCRDNLEILRGINSNSIDLIYLDPPFNKGKNFHAPVGTSAEGAEFDDIWKEESVKDELHNQINDKYPSLYRYLDATGEIGSRSAKYYLIYMAVRLIEMHRVLKDIGSIYLHCDPTASHYLKLLMDSIFGHGNFRNEIVWCYAGPSAAKRWFSRKHDIIFLYGKQEHVLFNQQYIQHKSGLHNTGQVFGGKDGNNKQVRSMENRGKAIEDYWLDIPSGGHISKAERIGYPTQKPLALLERIIKASSNEGDLVLDPFCGCATTCVASERLNRQWVGIDVSEKAYDLVKMRLDKVMPDDLGSRGQPILRKDIPKRTDIDHKKKPNKEDKQLLYGKQNGNCAGCEIHFPHVRHFDIDHIIPQSQGGGHELDNLQLLCGSCNSMKGDRPMEYLKAKLKKEFG